jgi:hypothetical protein
VSLIISLLDFIFSRTSSRPPPYEVKIKVKGRRFDTTEAIEAESQAVLHMLTEHGFQFAFKKRQKPWERCIHTERDYLKCDGGQ